MTQSDRSYSPIRRLLVALTAGIALGITVMENIELTHPGVLEHHHQGGQIVMVLAAICFGGIVGWGCSR